MAKDRPKNVSASIRQRLLNHSTAIKTDPNLVLIWYGLERFLYRLSVSAQCEQFVLKGAMLFRLWASANFRSTKDLDLEAFLKNEAAVIRDTFASICIQPVEDDGLTFDPCVVIGNVTEFVLPPAIAAASTQPFARYWKPYGRWQPTDDQAIGGDRPEAV